MKLLTVLMLACLHASSPYTITEPVVHAGHGAADKVYVPDFCRGEARSATILAVSDDGGEESEPAIIHPHHWTFLLRFGPGDVGRVYTIVGFTFTCKNQGGWGSYYGDHPRITVRR